MGGISTNRGSCRRRIKAAHLAPLLAISGLALFAAPAEGQNADPAASGQLLPPSAVLPPCVVVKQALTPNAEPVLLAGCRGHGLILGPATDYQVFRNDTLQATIVDVRNGAQRRVLLLTFLADDKPLLEDISGDISLSAGRGPGAALADLDIDFSDFASEGLVRARSAQLGGADAAAPVTIGIADHIVQERIALRAATGN